MMQKAERIIYGTPVMTANMNMMRCFVLAFMVKDQSFKYCVRKSRIDALLASLNSYTGIFKNINGFSIAYDMADALDKRWAEFVHFDRRRVCFVANEGYRHRQRICEKYGLLDPKKRRRL